MRTDGNGGKMTVHDNVVITGAFGITMLTDFEAHILSNAHATAVIKGIAKDITDLVRWQASEIEQEVTVSLTEGRILFCGLVENAVWKQEAAAVYRVEIQLISGSIALDRKKESMSFQNTELSYTEIVKKAIISTPNAYCICTTDDNEKPMRPMIQYTETNWEFAKRMASMVGTVIYPEVCRHGVYMWMGIPDCGGDIINPETKEYTHGISSTFYDLGGLASGYSQRNFTYYTIECGEDYRMGANVRYAGNIWKVLEKQIKLQRGEFRFTYLLGNSCLITVKKMYNPLFSGRSIHGTVITREGDSVKLHLEIDKTQSATSAYPYKWVPDTGSIMYCMPENGTTVSLYFPDEDERNAVAVNCIRYNGATCNEMTDTSKRALTTTEGKRLYLESEDIGFDIKKSSHKMSLQDEVGIKLESGTTMNISAVMGIEIDAKSVTIETTGPLNLLRNPER